jgi:hypothetical protein
MERERSPQDLLVGGAYLVADIIAVKHRLEVRGGIALLSEVQRTNSNRLGWHLNLLDRS